jgi:hypothetical protein
MENNKVVGKLTRIFTFFFSGIQDGPHLCIGFRKRNLSESGIWKNGDREIHFGKLRKLD